MIPERVPAGFVEIGSEEAETTVEELENDEYYCKLPCTLYTDRCGSNFFVIEMNETKYILPVATD